MISYKLDIHLVIIIGIIVSAGAFGGFLNYLHNFDSNIEDSKSNSTKTKSILLGIGAAFLVPAFLKMISSNLVSSADNNDLLIFAGFCIIASIFSRRFINTIGEKLLEAVKQVEKTSSENKQQLKTTQLDLTSAKERIEDVKLAVDLKNLEVANVEDKNEQTTELIELANSYIEKTSIPDYSERLRLKAEIGRRMGEIIVRNNLPKEKLLQSPPSEGMLLAIAYAVQLKPENDGLTTLNKISLFTQQLYTKYSILVAYDTLARNSLISKIQVKEVYLIIKKFRINADEPLRKKIDHSISILNIINPVIKE